MSDKLLSELLEIKIDDKEPGTFSGYGSTFGNIDRVNDICMMGCFTESLKQHNAKGTLPAMLWMHDQAAPIGEWTEMVEDGKGLRVKGKLWIGRGIPEAEKAYAVLKSNQVKGLSVGYKTIKWSWNADKQGVRNLEQLELGEVSVVGFSPANPKALVQSVKREDSTDKIVADALKSIFHDAFKHFDAGHKLYLYDLMQKKTIPDGQGGVLPLSDFLGH
jgi:HK97 family phage prohead protease